MWLILLPVLIALEEALLPAASPNILYMIVDDFGYNDVSWNNPAMHTPVLAQLAEEGVILDKFYSQPRCSPSRAALLTGIYPYKMSIQRGNISPFRPSGLATVFPTLPELLKESGYSTHLVGKWHLGYCHEDYLPTRRGFDTFFGQYGQQTDHYTRVDVQNRHIGAGYDLRRGENVTYEGAGVYSSKLWAQETVALLDKLDEKNQPWYLQVAFTAARAPFQAPDRFMEMYDKRKHGKFAKIEFDLESVRKGMVSAVDEAIGEIVAKLKNTGKYNNTIIIFSSDNGSADSNANLPFKGVRGHLTEGAVRVPAFVHSPLLGVSRQGTRSEEMVHITDWFPTILSLARHGGNISTDGLNIWPVIAGGEKGERDTIVYNLDMDDQSGNFQFGIRKEDWKLLWGHPEKFTVHKNPKRQHVELYNLSLDPFEENDVSETHQDLVVGLQKLVLKLAKEMKPSFQPNRYSLGYPRYQKGLLNPGWCHSNWWDILWKGAKINKGIISLEGSVHH